MTVLMLFIQYQAEGHYPSLIIYLHHTILVETLFLFIGDGWVVTYATVWIKSKLNLLGVSVSQNWFKDISG